MTTIGLTLMKRTADGDPAPFLPYTELPRRIPRDSWRFVRWASLVAYGALVVTLLAAPSTGLFLLWGVVVPVLPALFFVAPGVWRNLCPLAAANQTPRVRGFTRSLRAPAWLAERGHLVAITVFVVAVASRKLWLNSNGPAAAAVLTVTIAAAFAGGVAFRGKSGWCSSTCPLLPVQRLYGQTPFVTSPNSHCAPCVGCTKNCYDFNPTVAYQADLADEDPDWGASRRVFAGLFPGLVLGYFLLPAPPATTPARFVLTLLAAAGVSAGAYLAVQAFTRLTWAKVSAIWGATAFACFYWFAGLVLEDSANRLLGLSEQIVRWPVRVAAIGLALVWLARTFEVEQRFRRIMTPVTPIHIDAARLLELQTDAQHTDTPRITIEPEGREVLTTSGLTVLDAVEAAGLSIESGCRMGQCGADPIAVREGAANLGPMTDDERTTLRRLCLPAGNRLACQAVVLGDCTVALAPDRTTRAPASPPVGATATTTVGAVGTTVGATATPLGRVVVLGGGIAGVSVAELLRAEGADCDIALINSEPHHLYNRMGISRIIHGRSAMAGLYLLPDDWFQQQRVDCWLNTVARTVDLDGHTVRMATGEVLEWDHLVFATGGRPTIPDIDGFGVQGSFVLRDAGTAAAIRAHVQNVDAHHAVVGGGGVLGLEVAHSLSRLGLRVEVLERGERLLGRSADERASELLRQHLSRAGIEVRTRSTAAALLGTSDLEGVRLTDGVELPAQVFVSAVGITPNSELAREAGLLVNRGIVVDEQMRASAEGVYACGDVAEHDGRVWGLWPTAVRQAEVVARTILGDDHSFAVPDPPMVLKGVGVDLTRIGDLTDRAGVETIVHEDPEKGTYARLAVDGDRIRGGLLYGYKRETIHLHRIVEHDEDVAELLPRLREGDIGALAHA